MEDRPPGLSTEWHFGRTDGSLLFTARKLDLMSDSVCVLDGALPILKALNALNVHGSVWLQTSGKQTGSSKQYDIVCNAVHVPFTILRRLQGWDLVCYTSWHLLLNINFFIVFIFMQSAYWADSFLQVFPDSISIQVSWPDLQNWGGRRRHLNICIQKQFFEALKKSAIEQANHTGWDAWRGCGKSGILSK